MGAQLEAGDVVLAHGVAVGVGVAKGVCGRAGLSGVMLLRNLEPVGAVSLNSSWAPMHLASCWLMARPMPEPPSFVERQGLKSWAR